MDPEQFQLRLLMLIPVILSLSVHEWAHAWTARKLGDETAELQGRLTLNPISHIDPVGTLLLPLLGVPFGWAKPVPVDPTKFRSNVKMHFGMLLVAAAGPLSNFLIALVVLTVELGLFIYSPQLLGSQAAVGYFLSTALAINVTLALFNLLPIYPLDGSRIVEGLLPFGARSFWDRWVRISPYLFLAVIFLPSWYGFSLFSWPIRKLFEFRAALFEILAS